MSTLLPLLWTNLGSCAQLGARRRDFLFVDGAALLQKFLHLLGVEVVCILAPWAVAGDGRQAVGSGWEDMSDRSRQSQIS